MSHRSPFAILAFAAASLAAGSAQAATIRVLVGPGDTQTFSPQSVTIRVGDTVEWANENRGGMSHNVVADDVAFTSGAAAAGPWTFRHTFAATGNFGYYCSPHGGPGLGMFGTVVVTDAIELAHGSDMNDDLLGAADLYRIGQKPYSSYEVVVDPLAGNASLDLARLSGATTNVLQPGEAVSVGIDNVQSLRWQNTTGSSVEADRIRVSSSTCPTNCTAPDLYRVRAYDTTISFPRYNQTGSQISVVILQNTSNSAITGTLYLWNAAGQMVNLPGTPFTINPKAAQVTPVAGVPNAPNTSGTVTASHNGRYGDLSGKVVALEPSTGFSFDSPAVVHPR